MIMKLIAIVALLALLALMRGLDRRFGWLHLDVTDLYVCYASVTFERNRQKIGYVLLARCSLIGYNEVEATPL